MKRIANLLEEDGYVLRTWWRSGLEQSAIEGVDFTGNKIIVPGIQWTKPVLKSCSNLAWDQMPKWLDLVEGDRKRLTYLVQNMLGYDLNHKSKFIFTYEPEYDRMEYEFTKRFAHEHSIKFFDLAQFSFQKLWEVVYNL